MSSMKKQFLNGILYQNPTLVLLLGMCPTLAVSTSIINALGMGAAVTIVLILSNITMSALRKVLPDKIRIAASVVLVSGIVSIVDLLMQAFIPLEIYNNLGIFVQLIVVNCIILARAEAFAFKNPVPASAFDGLVMGLGFSMALFILAFFRELLGNGTLLGHKVLGNSFMPAQLLAAPAGGFLMLGLIIAALNKFLKKKEAR